MSFITCLLLDHLFFNFSIHWQMNLSHSLFSSVFGVKDFLQRINVAHSIRISLPKRWSLFSLRRIHLNIFFIFFVFLILSLIMFSLRYRRLCFDMARLFVFKIIWNSSWLSCCQILTDWRSIFPMHAELRRLLYGLNHNHLLLLRWGKFIMSIHFIFRSLVCSFCFPELHCTFHWLIFNQCISSFNYIIYLVYYFFVLNSLTSIKITKDSLISSNEFV